MKRKEIVKVCDRCPLGRNPTKAVRTIRFGFGTTFWDIDVCEKHGDQLTRELYAWGLMGRAVEEEVSITGGPRRFGRDYSENARRLAELRDRQAREDAEKVEAGQEYAAAATGTEMLAREGKAGKSERLPISLAAPADAGEYVFTEHAIQRMEERGVKAVDALWAASSPEVKRPGKQHGLEVRRRGNTHVVVNPATKVIITVAQPDSGKAIAL